MNPPSPLAPLPACTRRLRHAAFSLIEVVLAIGIVSFAIITILGIFGNVLKSSDSNTERRELAEAIDSLRRTFQTESFNTSYGWVTGNKTLLYVTYHANDTGQPTPGAKDIIAKWMDPANPPQPLAQFDAARSGRWIRAKLRLSPSNPGGTSLPSNPDDYDRALIMAAVTLDTIATPDPNAPSVSSLLETNLSILR